MLFSEPKIPQCWWTVICGKRVTGFSALQRAENSSIHWTPGVYRSYFVFQCSSASRKFLNVVDWLGGMADYTVSVLFSEPKIPQSAVPPVAVAAAAGFSALQRAENSSIWRSTRYAASFNAVSVLFSEPKIPQFHIGLYGTSGCGSFSALQRAENSSIRVVVERRGAQRWFQCSSASRKFLNSAASSASSPSSSSFSALQRAENSSISDLHAAAKRLRRFSALQRAENSSIAFSTLLSFRFQRFQCSSASRKFLNSRKRVLHKRNRLRFSALQRAENSSIL